MTNIIVTTALRNSDILTPKAKEISRLLNIPFIPRKDRGFDEIRQTNALKGIIVVSKNMIYFSYQDRKFFFHPSMSNLRIKQLINGKTDQMIQAMNLKSGDSVLDCTLGLGSDALVASFTSGYGEITGLEKSPVISLIVSEGMSTYQDSNNPELLKAMRRIKVVCADYNSYLPTLPNDSVDIVYFDPMFRIPLEKSGPIGTMRPLADNSPLTTDALNEALRVCRKKVVIKESARSSEFSRLGINILSGGKHSSIAYGIIEKGGG